MFQSANGSLDVTIIWTGATLFERSIGSRIRSLQQELGCFLPKAHCLPLPEKWHKAQFNRIIINEGYTTF